MAVESNGKSIESGQKTLNGKATNGHTKAPTLKAKRKPKPKGFNLLSTASWLLTWYSIVTILLRCPATENQLTDSSPKICKPYFQLRSVLAPHLEPYYDQYAAPYVDVARPYYNIVDQRIISPATTLGKKYGAPRLQQAQAFGQAQWQNNVQPQVSKYQGMLKNRYDQTIGPHVTTVVATTSPYYDIAKTNALQTYYEHILPTYTTVQPYAAQGYGIASEFAIGTALPYTKWAWGTGAIFLDRTVWPKIRILYGENVEPQLVRIGERLGRYRDGKKLMAVVDEVDSTPETSLTSTISETFSSLASSVAPTATPAQMTTTAQDTTTDSSEASVPIPESEEEIREKASKIVAHDLKTWQEKFAKAADEGSDELEERIAEITERLIRNQAQSVGDSLIIQLEETVKSSLNGLKSSIISIVASSKDVDESEEALATAVRKAGVAIKEKAQAVRVWRQNFDHETNSLISNSAQDTFEILDHIRDLGLQEIGMRWAWTDGITHKDWAKYHQLKTKFDEWRYDVEKVATEHPGLEKARSASNEVESRAMATAEDAAMELLRLKETGRWKISANDATSDFSTKYMPAAAAVAGQKVLDKINDISEAVAPTSQGTMESVASVASASLEQGVSSASSIVSSVAEGVTGTSQGTAESFISVAKASASSIAGEISSSVLGTPQGTVESAISKATESVNSLSAKVSASVIGEEPGVLDKATNNVKSGASVVSKSVSSLSDAASSSVSSASSQISDAASDASVSYGSYTSSLSDSVSKSASIASSSISSAASSASSTASKKVFGGAMAQHVEARQIVFEDVIDDSDDETLSVKIQSMASEVGDKFDDIKNAVSEALMGPTPTPDAMTKLAADKYSSALSAASVALYGTKLGTGESVSSLVSSRYADAVAAASSIIYGTPIPITGSIAAQATSAYNAALSAANEQYSNAKALISAQISGEPKPVHQEMLSSADIAYSEYVAAAKSKYQAAISAVSTAAYGTSTPAYQSVFESMSLMAQSKLSEGLSAASAQYQDAKSYVAAVQTESPAKQKLGMQIQDQYYAGIGMAHARYSEFMEAASSAIMPTPTPFLSKASASIIGTPTNKFQAALDTASSHYSQAVETASSQLGQIMASISKVGSGNKDVVPTASLAAVASSRYSAAVASASSSYSSIQSVFAQKAQEAASAVSSAVIGSETPWTESIASAASENWEALITKASSQIYGAPTPYFVTRRLLSEAKEYAAQASDGAAAQYSAVQSLIGELVYGKEPAFTESVYNRLSVAYYTGVGQAASSASSYASEAYASASSVVSSVFTPPPTLEAILDSAASRVNEAVDAASVQFYGTQKGSYEEAVSSASSAYSSMSSAVSEQVYGSSTGYVEAAQSSIADAASSAQKALSEALYGTPTGTYESITSAAGGTYASATSVVAENIAAASSLAGEKYASVHAAASEAIYGPEKGALESAQARLTAAVESARVKLAEYASHAGEGASAAVSQASEGVEDFASSISSVVSAATARARDEL